jgi:uncharacterized repeat protein (TIGR02059 family)
MKGVILVVFLAFCSVVCATTYYVAPNGDDNNPGTFGRPWATWQKGFITPIAGDTVFFRGGIYYPSTWIYMNPNESGHGHRGTRGKPICLFNYPGEVPILDGAHKKSGAEGIWLENAENVHLKGLVTRNNNQHENTSGVVVYKGNNIILENCTSASSSLRGFHLLNVDTAYIYNCDAYDNYDRFSPTYTGGAGDGFLAFDEPPYNNTASYTIFRNCRSWHNSDDGFDCAKEGYVEFDGCWSFNNGYDEGDGGGFKYGWDNVVTSMITRTIKNCLSVFNSSYGFVTNDASATARPMNIYNNIAYHNGYHGTGDFSAGFWIMHPPNGGNTRELSRIFRNNISYATEKYNILVTSGALYTHDHNSWDASPSVTVTDADFASVDETQLLRARKADGSLPDINFLHLVQGSDLINAGVDVGLPYVGNAPDLGAFETQIGSSPPAPLYLSSVIENTTPSVIELSYDLILAKIVPSKTAFIVRVNSGTRTINTVTISGSKVFLSLSSPVSFGDLVTVTYTKPSTNPLQTSSGRQAASISNQAVTNKVGAPEVPVYVTSSIENASPSILEMNYSLPLSNIIPPSSAFVIKVNSSDRAVSSVAISGTKVLITVVNPFVHGDVITVAYVKPLVNPLQTVSGAQAVSLNAQVVKNNIGNINTPPIIVVNYKSSSYSGFVNEIDASGSYDTNKDNLTYLWEVPDIVPVSSKSSSTIKYLNPIVNSPQTIVFTLRISDGKTTQSRPIPIEILPFKPELEVAEISNIEASSFQAPYYPYNIIDGNVGTMWSANGDNQWLIIELKQSFSVQHVKLAFQPGQRRESYFEILGSTDKVNWEPILTKTASCFFSGDLQVFEFPPSKTGREFNYVKLVGRCNSTDTWNYISELKIFGSRQRNSPEYEKLAVKVYPNPAQEFVTFRIDESTLMPDFVQLIDLSGIVVLRSVVDPDIREFTILCNWVQVN